MNKRMIVGFLGLVFIAGLVLADDLVPIAVSPGLPGKTAIVRQSSPTFSWTAMSWATTYKVVVFEAVGEDVPTYENMAEAASPVLVKEILGQASSWTPSAEEQLLNGGSYLWYVGAMVNAAQGNWSEGRRFMVAESPAWGVVAEPREDGIGESPARIDFQKKDLELTAEAKENFDLTSGSRSGVQASQGTYNTYYGLSAGASVTTGVFNSFFGRFAGYTNTSGNENTFVGHQAGRYNDSVDNTFIGSFAGYNTTTGHNNTFLGSSAGRKNAGGFENTFLGRDAGYSNIGGSYNVLVGKGAGYSNTSANYNTIIGWEAGHSNTTGWENTFIGDDAGYYNESGTRNVFIGNEAGLNETGSNKLYIANSTSSPPLIYGDFELKRVGINNNAPGAAFVVGTSGAYCNGGAWVDGSSREFKENIEELTAAEALRAFAELEPVKFNYKEDKGETYLGFVAEDVPDLVAMNDRKGLNPMDMVAVLTKVVQEQQKAISELKEKITTLEEQSRKEK